MRHVKVLTSRDPAFLKTTYPIPLIKLIDHEGYVDKGERFVTKQDAGWTVLVMTESRATIKVRSFADIHSALGAAQRGA